MWPGIPVVPVMGTGATDGRQLRKGGIPTYGVSGLFGDMDDSRAHGRDERMLIKSFYRRAGVSVSVGEGAVGSATGILIALHIELARRHRETRTEVDRPGTRVGRFSSPCPSSMASASTGFARRSTSPTRRLPSRPTRRDSRVGRHVFETRGCEGCHGEGTRG